MCLSIPLRLVEVGPEEAVGEAAGIRRSVSLALLLAEGVEVRPGDWVLAAAGLAHRRLEGVDAEGLLAFYQEEGER